MELVYTPIFPSSSPSSSPPRGGGEEEGGSHAETIRPEGNAIYVVAVVTYAVDDVAEKMDLVGWSTDSEGAIDTAYSHLELAFLARCGPGFHRPTGSDYQQDWMLDDEMLLLARDGSDEGNSPDCCVVEMDVSEDDFNNKVFLHFRVEQTAGDDDDARKVFCDIIAFTVPRCLSSLIRTPGTLEELLAADEIGYVDVSHTNEKPSSSSPSLPLSGRSSCLPRVSPRH